MSMPTPQAAHHALAPLAGTWTGEETMAPSPWDSKGGTAQARIPHRIDLDGFVLTRDYEQRRGDTVTFRGHGVLWWDAKASEYVMHWWDSMGGAPNEFRGTWQDNTLVLINHNERGYSRTTMRVQDGIHHSTLEMSPDGEQWSTWMSGTYQHER
jgi:hypothetical protein